MLHLNISLLSSHINDLVTFLNLLEANFNTICISKSKLSQKNSLTSNTDIPGYNIGHTPTEASAGGALIFISQTLPYKTRKDLQIYCAKELESVLIELYISKQTKFCNRYNLQTPHPAKLQILY